MQARCRVRFTDPIETQKRTAVRLPGQRPEWHKTSRAAARRTSGGVDSPAASHRSLRFFDPIETQKRTAADDSDGAVRRGAPARVGAARRRNRQSSLITADEILDSDFLGTRLTSRVIPNHTYKSWADF